MYQINGFNMSALMAAYNYAKAYGRRSGQWNGPRTDRALSYLMSGRAEPKWADYGTVLIGDGDCGCPDFQYRRTTCKHLIALMISVKYRQLMDQLKSPVQ